MTDIAQCRAGGGEMTLQEAIAEVRSGSPTEWTASLVADGHPYPTPLARYIATILNAVASGDLIPKADMAEAEARGLDRAADVISKIPGESEAIAAIRAEAAALRTGKETK